jgi:hypothetical protein
MALLCAFALAAVACASASGAEPEFGVCVKQSEGAAFSNAKCTKSASGSKARYAWKTEIAKPGYAITAKHFGIASPQGLFEGTAISCKSASGKGHYYVFGQKGTVITLEGCELTELEKKPTQNPPCSSEGAAPGEVTTETLDGELGLALDDESLPEGPGLEFNPEAGTTMFKATCGAVTVTVHGQAIGLLKPAAKMTSKSKLTFAATGGEGGIEEQNPTRFRARLKDSLEICVESCTPALIFAKFSISNEEAVEANPSP